GPGPERRVRRGRTLPDRARRARRPLRGRGEVPPAGGLHGDRGVRGRHDVGHDGRPRGQAREAALAVPFLDDHPWAPYAPGSAEPGTLRRAVHRPRRAGFGATWAEVQRDLAEGPTAALARLLDGKRTEGVPVDFEHGSELLADGATETNDAARLKCWW